MHSFPTAPDQLIIINDAGRFTIDHPSSSEIVATTTLAYILENEKLQLTLSSETAVSEIRLRWNQKFGPQSIFLADEVERGYGTMGWQKLTPNRIMPWYFMEDDGNGQTTGYGVMTKPNAFCYWQIDPKGITLILDVRNGSNGVILGDRKLPVATIISHHYTEMSSFAATHAFCQLMSPQRVLPQQPVYGSNNWYYAYGKSSATDILRDTDYIAKLSHDIPNRPFMVIDDGWQVDHEVDGYNGGPWRAGNQAFPNMGQLADEIKQRDVKPGIWFRPLWDHRKSIPDSWRNPHNGALDPTFPEIQSLIAGDVKQLCDWGYQLIKHDFTTFDLFGRWGFEMRPFVTNGNWHFSNPHLTNAEIVKQLYQVIFDAAKPSNCLILGCNTIGHLGTGLMQLARIGDDTSGKAWERTRQIGINSLAFRLPQDGAFFSIDADCVGITDQIDWYFNRQWAQVVAKSGTVLFLSPALNTLNEKQANQLHPLLELAAKQSQHCIPTDWKLTDCPANWSDGVYEQHYDWYSDNGIEFNNDTPRSLPFYSIGN